MNSDKLDMLLFTRHYLQNLDFHLTKVPNDKINRKEEKEMERTFRLRKKSFGFDKKGMILKGIVSNDEQFVSWEDKEPTLIQDILDRYEVIENEKI